MEVLAQDRSLTLWPSTVWAKVQRALRYKDQNYNVAARLQAHAVTDQVDLQVTANLDDATWVRLQAVTSPGTWYFWKCESLPLPKQKTSVASNLVLSHIDTFSHSPTLSTTFFHEQSLKPWGKQGSLWVRPNLQLSQKSQPQGQIQIRYQRPDVNNSITGISTDANTNDNVKSTTFQVDACSGDGRAQRRPGLKCTVSRFLDAYNVQLSPFVTTTRGVVGIHVEREFPDSGRLYATIQPTESIDVTWQEGSWTARLEAPLFAKGGGANNNNKIRMSLHRSLDLLI